MHESDSRSARTGCWPVSFSTPLTGPRLVKTVIISVGWGDDMVRDILGNRRHDRIMRIMMAPVESSRSGQCISRHERHQQVARILRHEPVSVTGKLLRRLHSCRVHREANDKRDLKRDL